MALPNPSMSFSPFAILTAEELNDLVANIESLADGSGLNNASIGSGKLALSKTTSGVWTIYDYGTWKEYEANFSLSVNQAAGAVFQTLLGSPPAGITFANTDRFTMSTYSQTNGNWMNYTFALTIVSGNLYTWARNNAGGTVAATGFVSVSFKR